MPNGPEHPPPAAVAAPRFPNLEREISGILISEKNTRNNNVNVRFGPPRAGPPNKIVIPSVHVPRTISINIYSTRA